MIRCFGFFMGRSAHSSGKVGSEIIHEIDQTILKIINAFLFNFWVGYDLKFMIKLRIEK